MNYKLTIPMAIICAVCLLCFVAGTSGKSNNVIIITIDTARADHFGFAGYSNIKTPNLDKLAQEGIYCSNAYTPAPLTLPAHVSILTGLYPQTHGVHDNDLFQLRKSVETIAEFLKEKNYHTAGFVSSIILNHQYGIDQGFDYYDDLHQYAMVNNRIVERTANTTTDAVCSYIKTAKTPLFLWVHYFDPHFPYQPPEPLAKEYASHPYDGEIAYVDNSIGTLLNCLKQKINLNDSIIVIASDHGEGLGQHDEDRHGILMYNSTIKVPLIVKIPGIKPAIIKNNVSLVDIVPTILDFLTLSIPDYLEGKSLLPYLAQQDDKPVPDKRVIFVETFMPYFTYRWAPLYGIIMNDYKFIKANTPELFSIINDPDENNNLYTSNKETALRYSSALYSFYKTGLTYPWDIKQFFDSSSADATIKEKLRSLGYASSPPAPGKQPANLPDPKSLIYLIKKLDNAQLLLYQGIYNEAFASLEEVLQKDKENGPALTMAAECLINMKMFNQALPLLKKAHDLYPQNDSILISLAAVSKNIGKPAEAETLLLQALQMNPQNPLAYAQLLTLYLSTKNMQKINSVLEEIKSKKLDHPDLDFAKSSYYIQQQNLPEAKILLEKGLAQSPENRSALANLAKIYYLENNIPKAIEFYEKFLVISPADAEVHAFVGSLYWFSLKDKDKASQHLQKALELDPQNAEADKWKALLKEVAPAH
jgi:arylsulfatase A-like enzyme/Tfp pilus assembly protein PilF